jgi:hypothetical protein
MRIKALFQKESDMWNKIVTCAVFLTSLTLQSAFASGGVGYFSSSINWQGTPDLYYSVAGAPASVCGDLVITRNGGSWTTTPGWMCTDGSGNATKGPWTWSGQSGDETAEAYIQWPDSSTTTHATHIWDKTCSITYPDVCGTPPGSFYGHATDTAWGAGFNSSWTTAVAFYKDVTNATTLCWTPSSGAYAANNCIPVDLGVSGEPSFSVTWSASQVPASALHLSHHSYEWDACVTDGSCTQCGSCSFTMP